MKSQTKYKINVISHKRPQNVQRSYYKDIIKDITYFVGDGEAEAYRDAGAINVVESGDLVASRNFAIMESQTEGKDCVIVEDDLKFLCLAIDKKHKSPPVSIKSVADAMHYHLTKDTRNMFYLAGVAPTDNTFYFSPNKMLSFKHFIVGSFIYIRQKSDIWFDRQFKTKEDYDYTLQHIQKYGGAVRLNYVLASFEHYGNKGGVVDWRTEAVEQDSIYKLKQKWGSAIKDNPRRPNEILLRLPK